MAINRQSSQLLLWFVFLSAVLLGVYFWLRASYDQRVKSYPPDVVVAPYENDTRILMVGDVSLSVEVQDTALKREQGLSGRSELPLGRGMLFVFDEPQKPLFWMKDMRFDLDMVWISDGKVIAIDRDVPAPSQEQPELATRVPPTPVDQILELTAGHVDTLGIEVGNVVELQGN